MTEGKNLASTDLRKLSTVINKMLISFYYLELRIYNLAILILDFQKYEHQNSLSLLHLICILKQEYVHQGHCKKSVNKKIGYFMELKLRFLPLKVTKHFPICKRQSK